MGVARCCNSLSTRAVTVAGMSGVGGVVGDSQATNRIENAKSTGTMSNLYSIREPPRDQDVGTCDSTQTIQPKTTWGHGGPKQP